MFSANKYFDFCVSENIARHHLEFLYQLGFRTIAINQVVRENADLEPKKKKRKGLFHSNENQSNDIIPPPIKIINDEYEDLKILNRLTIYFSNSSSVLQMIKSPNYKKYDIIAVAPETASAFSYVCSNMDVDILTFEPENKTSVRITRKKYNFLVNKGCFFEIPYSPAIEDQSKRKNIISTAQQYFTFGKSKNIIISSGADNRILLRSPYDIINLGTIFGLNEQQSKDAIGNNCFKLYTKSVGRCHGKTIMFVEDTKCEENKHSEEDTVISIDDSVILVDDSK